MTNNNFFQIINLRTEYECISSRRGFPAWAKDGTLSNIEKFLRTRPRNAGQRQASEIALKMLEMSK